MTDATPDTGAPAAANGAAAEPAAELALPEVSPREKRRLREEARREVKAAEKARLEAAAKKAAAVAAPDAAKPAAPAAPELTDAQLRENAGLFLRGVLFPVLSLLARPFGYRLDLAAFTEGQARDDGAAWVPVLRLYTWLRTVVTWTAVPARLIARVRELARKREATKEPAP